MAKVIYYDESKLVFAEKPAGTKWRFVDIEGQKFNRLTVIGYAGSHKRVRRWFSKCDCGKIISTPSGHLKSGNTKSCGCLERELTIKRNYKHGHAKRGGITNTYYSFQHMMDRCMNENNKDYHHYGGRGIRICERWMWNFDNFLADMGEAPKKFTLERDDVNGDYCPENCRWATRKEQSNNMRRSVLITENGKTQTAKQWSEELGVNYSTIYSRLYRGRTPSDDVLSNLPRKNNPQCLEINQG